MILLYAQCFHIQEMVHASQLYTESEVWNHGELN